MPYANPEDQRACKRRSYARNREKEIAKVRAWRAKTGYKNKKRVLTGEAKAFWSFRTRRQLTVGVARAVLAVKTACAFCGSKGELHLDHIVPRSRGGCNRLENLQWLCPTCNSAKGALTPAEFFAHIRKILSRTV